MTTNLFTILSRYGASPVRAPDYKISSRLTGASGTSAVLGVAFTDWFSYAADEMSRYDPDLVVFMVGANDAAFVDPDVFGAEAGRMMDLLRRDGRVVAWVGMPAFVRKDLAARAPLLNAAARASAGLRSWVVFVDTSDIAPDGDDGVHFSPGQGRLLAEAVIRAVFPTLAQ
jgi:lysophospholipase L1-like esterase